MITPEHREVLIKSRKNKLDNRKVCKRGHPWVEGNIEYRSCGRRSCKECRKIDGRNRARAKNKTQKGKDAKKNVALKIAYGITFKQYQEMLERQNYRCAICSRPQSEFTRKFSVDHCHITDVVRGLLCGNCNVGIGNLQDDINILENAIKYLKRDK